MSADYMLRMLRREGRRRRTGRANLTRGTYPDLETVDDDLPVVVRPADRSGVQDVSSGGAAVAMHFYDVEVPFGTDIRRGDVLTITRSRDPQMMGRWLTVRESTIDEELASKRVLCEESVQ
jgi:hypothetical protein